MPYVPPWLDVSPRDFVNAAAAGGRLGAELAQMANERGIADSRNATALQEASMRENTALSGQQSENALASARLAQLQKQQESERALREWEIQQQMTHGQNVIDAENQRAANALNEKTLYGNAMLGIRQTANDIAQQRADQAANKPSPSDFVTVTQHTKEVPPSKQYDISEPAIHNWFSKDIPATSLTTTNLADLNNLPRGSTIVTNTIPGTGTPARTISRRVPASQDPYAISIDTPAPAQPQAPNPLEGKRVRHKDSGQEGTIINGVFVPDQSADEAGASQAD